ncbi:F-box protein [Rhynchospora pubera]|uniref:F-box protein n=1 Tax=Rhynchospora pubera TaxID=906938 RepID=A0AAV8HG36_9POAL|nr:F-box protein [Rhynchospora pubera]
MGQTGSTPLTRFPSFSNRRSNSKPQLTSPTLTISFPTPSIQSSPPPPDLDYTSELPDEVLCVVFHLLPSSDRKRCSLVCRRWWLLEGQSRQRLALNAQHSLLDSIPTLFDRFSSVSKLALKCDRRSDSIGDEGLAVIARRCPGLTRLKLRACRAVTDAGMEALAESCPKLCKLSVGSCSFGSKGIEAVLRACKHLEELSVKRLRGLSDSNASPPVSAEIVARSLRAVCLKELYNGQCFSTVISNSPNLKVLKLFRCAGDWDPLLEDISVKVLGVTEVHLEKLQVSDRGLMALSACPSLEVLHLVKTPECTDTGLTVLAEKCNLLRKIHIDGWKTNRIGDQGLIAIAKRCPNLQELVLIGVNPTARSLELVATNCANLERLALCGSETFGDAEITCIAAKCLALKKLCIKGCPISDLGMEALAEGCPRLVKVKVKKCRGVTAEFAEWLRMSRGSLAVNFDAPGPTDGAPDVSEMVENAGSEGDLDDRSVAGEQLGLSNGNALNGGTRASAWKTRVSIFAGRNFFVSAFRRLHGSQ